MKTSEEAKDLSKQSGVIFQDLPSFGTFSTQLVSKFSFGVIPTGTTISGLMMDIQGLNSARVDIGNNLAKAVSFHRVRGMYASANEHLVPEKIFSNTEYNANGISAVKALELAVREGQKIFNININNVDKIDEITVGDKSEMLNAIYSGKEVIVHQSPLQGFDLIDSGYIIIDPNTGAGAYLITGGSNGGNLDIGPIATVMHMMGVITGGLLQLGKISAATAGPVATILLSIKQIFELADTLKKCAGKAPPLQVAGLILLQAFMLIHLLTIMTFALTAGPAGWVFAQVTLVGLGATAKGLKNAVCK